ncbi:hypothetical protein V1514DRAFT_292376 [Lipomyces japonicus]|uniref:uncharacterized protein n=1 Tax=Lipomyces japonicus TaxID=56871 RepID=UPI0034CE4907
MTGVLVSQSLQFSGSLIPGIEKPHSLIGDQTEQDIRTRPLIFSSRIDSTASFDFNSAVFDNYPVNDQIGGSVLTTDKPAEVPVDEASDGEAEFLPSKFARWNGQSDVTTVRRSKPRPKCYHCEYEGCGKSFTRPCRLEEHIRSHTGERPYTCSFEGCNKSFLRDSHLKAHESSHQSERRYKCEECGHGFNTNQHLKRHILTHQKKAPYVCTGYPSCSEAFHKQSQLRNHVSKVHTHLKPFICSFEGCEKSFSQNSRLQAHEARSHSNALRYVCGRPVVASEVGGGILANTPCDERFRTWSALQKHIKNDHKAVCVACGVMFSKQALLRQHMRTHESSLDERRKFICEYCNHGFTRKHALSVHTSTVHENKRPFACEYEDCDRSFGHNRLLKEHISNVHDSSISLSADPDGKFKTVQDMDSLLDDQAECQPRQKLIAPSDIIDRLAGTGYEESGRHVPCAFPDCEFRFAREYDMNRHMLGFHGIDDGTESYSAIENATISQEVSTEDDEFGLIVPLDPILII